jgi:hypothetical protein
LPSSPLRIASLRPLAVSWIAIAAIAYALYLWGQTRAGLSNGEGRPFGDDFLNYWSAAFLAWHGRAGEIYNWNAFHAFQQGVTGASLDFYHYSYPPVMLLLTAPLAALPYIPALFVWLGASGYMFYRALKIVLPHGAVLAAFSTPALFVNALGGQNGAWTAALFGGGLCLLEKYPVVAGISLGLLCYKPQLGVLLPFALLAGRQWRAFFSAALTVILLVAISTIVFGAELWSAYLHNISVLRATILEDGTGVWHRMVSVFVFVRRLGGSISLAYAVQLLAAVAAGVLVIRAWWKDAPPPVRNSLLVLGTCLATPYLQDYDLVMLAFVTAWMVSLYSIEGARLPAGIAIACGFLLAGPLLVSPVQKFSGFPIGPVLFLPAVVLILAAYERDPFRARETKPD